MANVAYSWNIIHKHIGWHNGVAIISVRSLMLSLWNIPEWTVVFQRFNSFRDKASSHQIPWHLKAARLEVKMIVPHAWVITSNMICGMKFLLHPQTSTAEALNNGDGEEISSHTLLSMVNWKLFFARITNNLCQGVGAIWDKWLRQDSMCISPNTSQT